MLPILSGIASASGIELIYGIHSFQGEKKKSSIQGPVYRLNFGKTREKPDSKISYSNFAFFTLRSHLYVFQLPMSHSWRRKFHLHKFSILFEYWLSSSMVLSTCSFSSTSIFQKHKTLRPTQRFEPATTQRSLTQTQQVVDNNSQVYAAAAP